MPTSRATRVTSAAKLESWSTIEFTVVPMRANSPFTGRPSISSAIFWFRSPSATATITRATSVVGRTRSSIRPLTESIAVLQRAAGAVQAGALGHAALAADDLGHADELGLERGVARGHLVVGGLEAADVVLAPRRQADAEIAGSGGVQGMLEAGERRVVEPGPAVAGGAVGGLARPRRWSASWRAVGPFPRPAVGRLSRGAGSLRSASAVPPPFWPCPAPPVS